MEFAPTAANAQNLSPTSARIALPTIYFRGMMESDARKVNDVGPDLSTKFGDEVPGAP